ncbi:hypothetical protein [Prosthecobacter sp.]|uniref:hypothetical protein n=1 Tax=Prosthecobacter sp. TaxID=1965333 RepID=UPI0037831B5E
MKFFTLLSILALTASVRAETTLTMTGVHNCCGSCAKGIIKAGSIGEGVTIDVPEKSTTVTITSKKKGDAMKAAEAIIAGGYFGKIEGAESDSKKSTSKPATAAKPEAKMAKATVSGVHLCCKKCEVAAANAVKTVPGITKSDIVAKATSFTVEGEFTKSELETALNAAGFAGDIK